MRIDPQIKKDIKSLLLKKTGESYKKVTVVSPYKLSSEEINNIKKKIDSPDAVIDNVVDKNIIGGLILKYGSKMIDYSILGVLTNLENKLHENT